MKKIKQPKYKIGDIVTIIVDNNPTQARIVGVAIDDPRWVRKNKGFVYAFDISEHPNDSTIKKINSVIKKLFNNNWFVYRKEHEVNSVKILTNK